jgi:hypothetical protein
MARLGLLMVVVIATIVSVAAGPALAGNPFLRVTAEVKFVQDGTTVHFTLQAHCRSDSLHACSGPPTFPRGDLSGHMHASVGGKKFDARIVCLQTSGVAVATWATMYAFDAKDGTYVLVDVSVDPMFGDKATIATGLGPPEYNEGGSGLACPNANHTAGQPRTLINSGKVAIVNG